MSIEIPASYQITFLGGQQDCFQTLSNWCLAPMRLGCGRMVEVSANGKQFVSGERAHLLLRLFAMAIAWTALLPLTLLGLALSACSSTQSEAYQAYERLLYGPEEFKGPEDFKGQDVAKILAHFQAAQNDHLQFEVLLESCLDALHWNSFNNVETLNEVLQKVAKELQPDQWLFVEDSRYCTMSVAQLGVRYRMAQFCDINTTRASCAQEMIRGVMKVRYPESQAFTTISPRDLRYLFHIQPKLILDDLKLLIGRFGIREHPEKFRVLLWQICFNAQLVQKGALKIIQILIGNPRTFFAHHRTELERLLSQARREGNGTVQPHIDAFAAFLGFTKKSART